MHAPRTQGTSDSATPRKGSSGQPASVLRKARWVLLLGIAWPALAGCSWLINVDRNQCAQDRDCKNLGLAGTCIQGVCVETSKSPVTAAAECDGGECARSDAGPISASAGSCLGSMRCPHDQICFKDQCVLEPDVERFICAPTEPAVVDTIRFRMRVVEFVTQQPPHGIAVRACRGNDVGCSDPVATFMDSGNSGNIDMNLPFDFKGFLEVRSEDALTALWYFTQPLREEREAKDLQIPSPASLQLLASITGKTVDMSRGLVVLEAFDCTGTAVGGIHFEGGKNPGVPFYIVDQSPNVDSTVTVFDVKDLGAAGGFLNAPPGFTIFSARVGLDGPLLGQFNAEVRADTATYLDIHP